MKCFFLVLLFSKGILFLADPVQAATDPLVPYGFSIPEKFKHPGLLHSREELDFVKGKIQSGEEPWKSAFEQMKASKWADLNYKPAPRETVTVEFSGKGGGPGGAYSETNDAIAAYTQALMWIFTGDERYAQNAVTILNAWSILRNHEGGNWYLQAAWSGAMFPQGAELIRATYPKWSKEEQSRFSEMLGQAYLRILHNRMSYGNRELAVCNALVAIGVFNDDRAAFAEGISHWLSYVPCWIYLKEDGSEPKRPDYWITGPSNEILAGLDPGKFQDVKQSWIFADISVWKREKKLADDKTGLEKLDMAKQWNNAPPEAYIDGLCAETFRDLGHCDLGFTQLINTTEIARHQGLDLYAKERKRITAFMELQSGLRMDDPIPPAFAEVKQTGVGGGTYEIAYNHYYNQMGIPLPKTKKLIEMAFRPSLTKEIVVTPGWASIVLPPEVRGGTIALPADLNHAWETLTHAKNPER